MNVLKEADKQFYEEQGYLIVPGFLSTQWLDQIRAVVEGFIEESRTLTASTNRILLEPTHCPDSPRLRRIPNTVCHDPVFEKFGLHGPILDIAEDLLGPDVRFHHSKLNFKWSDGGEEVKWHQDIQFWPHTNYSPLTIGVYLADVTSDMAPMGIVPGSHRNELFVLADETGKWNGSINRSDLQRVDLDRVAWLTGPAGSVTVHSCRSIHGSMSNRSARVRPLLLHTYSAADALPVTDLMYGTPHSNSIVCGKVPKHIRFDPLPCPMPPDFRKESYSSIFAMQKKQ